MADTNVDIFNLNEAEKAWVTEYTFKPIRGLEEDLMKTAHTEGALLIATDSGRMWMDTPKNRIALGGSGASLLYANSTPIEIIEDENYFYTIYKEDLTDAVTKPQINDLIINNDGSFYRIIRINDDELVCSRIAVSGTGGGGGVSTGGKPLRFKIITDRLDSYTVPNGQSAVLGLLCTSGVDSDGEPYEDTLMVDWNIRTAEGVVYEPGGTIENIPSGETFYFDFGKYLRDSTSSIIELVCRGNNQKDGEKKKANDQKFTTVEMRLTEPVNFSNASTYDSNNVSVECTVSGKISKYVELRIDGNKVAEKIEEYNSNLSADTVNLTFNVSGLPHGFHEVEILLSQYNNGKVLNTLDKTLKYEIAVTEEGNTDPIIWLGDYKKEYLKYDSIKIPYHVYTPTKQVSTVTLMKGTTELDTREEPNGQKEYSIFQIVDAVQDIQNTYIIQALRPVITEGQDKFISRAIEFNVIKDESRANFELVAPGSMMIKFDSAGRSNTESESRRQSWSYTDTISGSNRTYVGEFKNFNWYNNGWVLDENKDSVLRISNGASFAIPIGHTIVNDSKITANQSRTFEFEFKIRNVQNYDKLIKEHTRYVGDDAYWIKFSGQDAFDNYDSYLKYICDNSGGKLDYDEVTKTFAGIERIVSNGGSFCEYYDINEHGFKLGPQDGFFKTQSNTLSFNYIEDKLMNLSIVFDYSSKKIYIYVQGILTAVSKIDDSSSLEIAADKIIFNSDACDIDLYKMRVYDRALSVYDILINHAKDHADVLEYDQTANLLEYNKDTREYELKYSSVVDWNASPERADNLLMPYVVWDTGSKTNQLPNSKSDDKKVAMTFVNPALDRAYTRGVLDEIVAALPNDEKNLVINNAEKEGLTSVQYYYKHHCPSFTSIERKVNQAVQGTSSQAYPRRNYKSKTKGDDGVIYMYMNSGPFVDLFKQGTASLSDEERKGMSAEEIKEWETEKQKALEKCHLDFFYYNNYSVGTTKFTMKIDFMESSGTYNMGLANLVHTAYEKHPLDDYSKKHAFSKAKYVIADEAERDSNMTYYIDNNGKNKAAFTDENPYVPNTFYKPTWEEYSFTKQTPELRTNVQGFPVMGFWKWGDNSDTDYRFIGRYNMLLDKGSDEAYGFKPSKGIGANFFKEKKGVKTDVRKIAECWEYSNNQRGYCSFKDPLGRHKLSFDYKGLDGKRALTAHGAPAVADSYEYRYNANDDLLDYIYGETDKQASLVEDGYMLTDLTDSEWKAEKMLDIYKNWERANQWVWSTYLDNVPSEKERLAGTPARKIMKYEPASGQYDKNVTYYDEYEDIVETAYALTAEELGEEETKFIKTMIRDYIASTDDTLSADKQYYTNDNQGNYEIVEDINKLSGSAAQNNLYELNVKTLPRQSHNYSAAQKDEIVEKYPALAESFKESVPEIDESGNLAEGKYFIGVDSPVSFDNGKTTYEYETKEYRKAKFIAEFEKHFNMDYSLIYFVITEVMLAYDSRGKNCMMASWGPQEENGDYIWYPVFYDMDTQLGINNTGIPSFEYGANATTGGTFSTSDSILWNNLYECFPDNIKSMYDKLRGLNITRGGVTSVGPLSTIDHIENWYLARPFNDEPDAAKRKVLSQQHFEMCGDRPLAMFNMDEWYKYISITNSRIGYQLMGQGMATDDGRYFYALQGDRSLSRQQFLTKRIKFIDSWLGVRSYKKDGGIQLQGRFGANNAANYSDKWVEESTTNTQSQIADGKMVIDKYYLENQFAANGRKKKKHYLDTDNYLTIKPTQNSYVALYVDDAKSQSGKQDEKDKISENAEGVTNEYKGKDAVIVDMPGEIYNKIFSEAMRENLIYIMGADELADIGDVSKLYWSEFKAPKATKLQRLLLGNDDIEFYNKGVFTDPTFDANAETSDGGKNVGKPLLREVNLSGITFSTADQTFDFTSSEKMRVFKGLRSNFKEVKFAKGVALDTLYLPNSVANLTLVEANNLTTALGAINVTDGTKEDYYSKYNEETDVWTATKGLYIHGLSNAKITKETADKDIVPNTTKLAQISLVGGALGYGSYDLLYKLYRLHKKQGSTLQASMTNVDWSPYKKLDIDTEYDANTTYYTDNLHYGFKEYVHTTGNQWDVDLANGLIYYLDEEELEAHKNTITDIDMLLDFIKYTQFKNVGDDSEKSTPVITGTIYVNNDTAIDENEIRNTLFADGAFDESKLDIRFKTVTPKYKARFVQQEADGTIRVIGTQVLSDASQHFKNPLTLYEVKRDSYDFNGWSTSNAIEGNTEIIIRDGESAEKWDASAKTAPTPEVFDYTYYAIFRRHPYKMTFMAGSGDNFVTVYEEQVLYGDYVTTPNISPSIDESKLPDEERYKFIGWGQNKNAIIASSERSARVVDVSKVQALNSDLIFYAVFIRESVYDSVIDLKYLRFEEVPGGYTGKASDTTATGWQVHFEDLVYDAATDISGKITLPTEYKGEPVIQIAQSGFSGCTGITHVFFDNKHPCKMLKFSPWSFSGCKSLKKVKLPDSLEEIGNYCFAGDTALEMYDISGANLQFIGTFAFSECYKEGTTVEKFHIGSTVKFMWERAFNALLCDLQTLVIGEPGHPTQLQESISPEFTYDWIESKGPTWGVVSLLANVAPEAVNIYCDTKDQSRLNTWAQKYIMTNNGSINFPKD